MTVTRFTVGHRFGLHSLLTHVFSTSGYGVLYVLSLTLIQYLSLFIPTEQRATTYLPPPSQMLLLIYVP